MTLPTSYQNNIFTSNGTSHQSFSTAEYYRRLPGEAYPDIRTFKEVLPRDWNIRGISIDVRDYEDVIITVTRVLESVVSDVLADIHGELAQYVTSFNMDLRDNVAIVEYKLFMSQEVYCRRIPALHKIVYEEQFHKDFENVDPKQV